MDYLVHLLITYRYFVLFPFTIIEGPAVSIIGGFLASLGYLNLFIVYVVVIVGDMVGDSMYYAAGRWGRGGFLQRWGHLIGITETRVEKLEGHFQRHSGKTLILGKLTHVGVIMILVAAGVARVPFWEFLWYDAVATIPKSLALVLIGFFFGHAYKSISHYLDYGTYGLLIVAATSVIGYLLWSKYRSA
jgi:membrane protein DedA with SNARE-associated domain